MTVALKAAFLVCCAFAGTIGCAPPPEPYSAPAPADTVSGDDAEVRYVALTEDEREREAHILSMRLPDHIGSSADVIQLREMQIGDDRYALVRCKTVSNEDRWLLFCFNTNRLEFLAKDARLVSNSGIDSFTFTVTETENGLLKLPYTVQFLRVSGDLREYTVTAQPLGSDVPRRTGPVDADGSPVSYDPLPALDLLNVTSSGVEMGFSRTSGSGLFYPFTDIACQDCVITVTLTGCLLSDAVPQTVVPSGFSVVNSVRVKQSGENLEITIDLTLKNPRYTFTASEHPNHCSVTVFNFS